MITPLPALLEENPIIIAIKDEEGLARCLQNPKPVVFVLYGSVVSIPAIVQRLKQAGKTVFVDVDLLDGLSAREAAVEYLAGATRADGVISTKAALVRRAKALGLAGVYRTFLLDNMALQSLRKSGGSQWADFIEILPGYAKRPRPAGLLAGAFCAFAVGLCSALSPRSGCCGMRE